MELEALLHQILVVQTLEMEAVVVVVHLIMKLVNLVVQVSLLFATSIKINMVKNIYV